MDVDDDIKIERLFTHHCSVLLQPNTASAYQNCSSCHVAGGETRKHGGNACVLWGFGESCPSLGLISVYSAVSCDLYLPRACFHGCETWYVTVRAERW